MKTVFVVDGLGCPNCAAKMERGISKLEGVTGCSVNFITGKLILEADEKMVGAITNAAQRIVDKIEPGVKLRKI